MNDVPVQYFQSVIAVQLAVIGALLWNINYFGGRSGDGRTGEPTRPWLRLLVALVLAATLFGSLSAILHDGQALAASAVTVGLALSMIPILVRVLPPMGRAGASRADGWHVTPIGLAVYVLAVIALVVTFHR